MKIFIKKYYNFIRYSINNLVQYFISHNIFFKFEKEDDSSDIFVRYLIIKYYINIYLSVKVTYYQC